MAISEKVELLGKGLYKDIPDELTLTSIPTISELDYVGGEDFDKVMIETILPQAVEEKINFGDLLEIDFTWVCRCLRLLNYGPYHTTNSIFCSNCHQRSYGEYRVNLNTIECKTLPEGFVNDIKISKDEFIHFDGDITLKLPTIQEMINAYKDKAFQNADGSTNRELARMCYMIKSIKNKKSLTPVEIKIIIQKQLSAADYRILREVVRENTDYGLRAGGSCQCPKCGNKNATFLALTDDRFFRPSVGDLREWKHDNSSRAD
jgi:hypothetical protein